MASKSRYVGCEFIGNILSRHRVPVFGDEHALRKLRQALESDGLELLDLPADFLHQGPGPTISQFKTLFASFADSAEPDFMDVSEADDTDIVSDFCAWSNTSDDRASAADYETQATESQVSTTDQHTDSTVDHAERAICLADAEDKRINASPGLVECTGGDGGQKEFFDGLWLEFHEASPPPVAVRPYDIGILVITTNVADCLKFKAHVFETSGEDSETRKVVWAVCRRDGSSGTHVSETWQVLGRYAKDGVPSPSARPGFRSLGLAEYSVPASSIEGESLPTSSIALQHIAVAALKQTAELPRSPELQHIAIAALQQSADIPSSPVKINNLHGTGRLRSNEHAINCPPSVPARQLENPHIDLGTFKRARSQSPAAADSGPPRKKACQLKQEREAIDLTTAKPEQILTGDPDLVRQQVLLFVARFFSNTHIFDALNAGLHARGRPPIKSVNNIAKLISLAIDSAASRNVGITSADLRRELNVARDANGVKRRGRETERTGPPGHAQGHQSRTSAALIGFATKAESDSDHDAPSMTRAKPDPDDEWRLFDGLYDVQDGPSEADISDEL